jgi:hypothetical protein
MCGHILQGATGGQTGTEQRGCATGAPTIRSLYGKAAAV